MPWIIENGEKRFVSQQEWADWNKANGLPTPTPRNPAGTNTETTPAGGSSTDYTYGENPAGMTSKQRRALVQEQQKAVDNELAANDAELANYRLGKGNITAEQAAKLEARNSELGDAANQLDQGRPVTSGLVPGGTTSEKIIIGNTTNTSPNQPLPTYSEQAAQNADSVSDQKNAGYPEAVMETVPAANIQTRAIDSGTSGGYPARPNTYVPPSGVDRFPAQPTQDDEINQAVAAQRARLGVSRSSIVDTPADQPVDSGATGATAMASYSAPPSPDTNSLGITTQTTDVSNPFQQGVPQDDPYAAGRTNALGITSEANVTSLRRDVPADPIIDPYATGTNPLGVTAEANIEGNPFQQGVPGEDPLAAQADGIGETNALGITGEARVGPFAQINPYADDPTSTDPALSTNPEAVDPVRSGLPQPKESFGTFAGTDAATEEAAGTYAQTEDARQQQSIRSQRSGFNNRDWRVRISLAPKAQYLYKVAATGDILNPLRYTDGVIFPYTPNIQIGYRANYDPYDMVHSNIRGLFYKNSTPTEISVTGVFTAQDTSEANYLLAVIHFFRSCTKMFYGQDASAGTPPPLVYMSGYGDYQFAEHPCVVTNFNYHLPADVDYIRARSVSLNNTNLVTRRDRQTNAPSTSPIYSAIARLQTIFMPKGGLPQNQSSQPYDTSGTSVELGGETPTYVPTQMEIQITMLPIQSRSQMSKQFSLDKFAQGDLLKGGFW
jgi:hypothetical protein